MFAQPAGRLSGCLHGNNFSVGSCQHKAKPIGFNFSHTFHLVRMQFDVVREQFKLNILRLLGVRFVETREKTTVLQTGSKNFNVGIHSDIHQ